MKHRAFVLANDAGWRIREGRRSEIAGRNLDSMANDENRRTSRILLDPLLARFLARVPRLAEIERDECARRSILCCAYLSVPVIRKCR